jgi:hypothetical protein
MTALPGAAFLNPGCQEEPSKSLTVDHENTHLPGGICSL